LASHQLLATRDSAGGAGSRHSALDTRLQSGFAGLDLRPDGFGAPFTGVVDAFEGGIGAGGFAGAFVLSEFADSIG
jgi:hypothetical protein